MVEKIRKSEEEWRRELTPERFEVCRRGGTERSFTGAYHDCKEKGVYRCACCGAELFGSEAKFDSGTGWPSFTRPRSKGSVEHRADHGLGMPRTEVVCARCDAHLGHVFDDGPEPTGKRYCVNSISLDLDPSS